MNLISRLLRPATAVVGRPAAPVAGGHYHCGVCGFDITVTGGAQELAATVMTAAAGHPCTPTAPAPAVADPVDPLRKAPVADR
jgi:hypothetical protein